MGRKPEGPRRSGAELWPWSPVTAIVLAPVILVVLATGLAVLRRSLGWPSEAYQGWALLAVAVLAMLPVLFVLVQLLARTGGEFKYRSLSLSFAAASQEAASAIRTTTLDENLSADPGDALERTSLNSVLRALRRARDSDVTVVDLRAGSTWWESRLLILVAGAARRDRPQALAFIGERNGQRGAFLGWASPARLLELHLAADPAAAEAYFRAAARTAQWRLGIPSADPRCVTLPWDGQAMNLPFLSDARPEPEFAFELFLQEALEQGPGREPRYVSLQRLRELYEPVLMTDDVQVGSDDDVWISLLRRKQRQFYAVTSNGALQSLVPREALLTALVLRLGEEDRRAAGGGAGATARSVSNLN